MCEHIVFHFHFCWFILVLHMHLHALGLMDIDWLVVGWYVVVANTFGDICGLFEMRHFGHGRGG